jgi:hypothetical protein
MQISARVIRGMEPGSVGIDAGANVGAAMAGKRTSRKRRRQKRAPREREAAVRAPREREAAGRADSITRGYSRSRAKEDQARAALKPLRPGERPAAVTVGAVAATLLAIANLVALGFGYDASEDAVSPGSDFTGSVIAAVILGVVAYGMWKARYWGVLGMQTLLALTLVFASLSLITAQSLWAALLLLIILAAAGTLFWFLIKAMARIQMPGRPGSQRTS